MQNFKTSFEESEGWYPNGTLDYPLQLTLMVYKLF